MTRSFLFVFFFVCVQAVSGQFLRDQIINLENKDKDLLSWGYYLGFNQYDFKFNYEESQTDDILVNKSIGFNVGLVGEVRLNDYFDIRFEPGLYYTQRDLMFPGFVEQRDMLREVKSTYIHFPLLLKISTKRINNFKPFIVGGLSTSVNLSSNEDNPDDNRSGNFRMKESTYYYELGFGIDFYLYYFKFTPSIRGVFALNDELVPDADPNSAWTSGITKMATRGVFINFTFE
ncbi:type IX secretion/gliding motility protein PorT/SprT [Spongiivirga citrea]|uniref:Outer membrane beta-barrel protein n=1 Tax=Spongiivirga citrea TaxID=1481457 RepID=A0A6M0CT28_9FLAO|nr:porin family protein [Spongiivirga citrea]NER18667.1 outer membrane beta-barrel protein [Spongiivirga citrea]